MPKTRTMGAGLAGSTARNVSVNSNTGGGNKKQGLVSTTNKGTTFSYNAIKTRSYGENRNVIFCVNQLGGVGAVGGGNGSRMFGTTSDGVKDCITGPYGCEQVVREAYLEAYGREPDKSGLRTYCIAMTKRRWSKADVIADLEKNEDSLAPIYASLAGSYVMWLKLYNDNIGLRKVKSVNIDNQGNITGSPQIGKITVISETEYSLTMDDYGVENIVGGPNNKTFTPARSYGNMPRINACQLYFGSDDIDVAFFKDTDGDGVGDLNDPHPENDEKTSVTLIPTIVITGNNPLTVELGSGFNPLQGVSATDELGDSISNPNFNTENGDVDLSYIDVAIYNNNNDIVDVEDFTETVGSYKITYTAYDNWNLFSTATRTVNVVDTTAPVITLNGDEEITVEVDVDGTYEDAGATATDNSGETISVTVAVNNVDITQVGEYSVGYEASDTSGNTSVKVRTVNVVDTTSPVITLLGNNPYTVYLGSSVDSIPGATATDASSENNLTVTVDGAVDTNTLGTYTLTYTAKDESNNSASVTRTVNVEELTHIYSFQNLYNALISDDGVDGRLIQVNGGTEYDDGDDDNKKLLQGPNFFPEIKRILPTTWLDADNWFSKDWYGSDVGWQELMYKRAKMVIDNDDGILTWAATGTEEVSVPGLMLLDPATIPEMPTGNDDYNFVATDDQFIGLSIIQLVTGAYANGMYETDPMIRFVWRLPEGTESFYYKLYLRYSPSEQAGTSEEKEDYQIMHNDDNFATYASYGVGKASYGATFDNIQYYDGSNENALSRGPGAAIAHPQNDEGDQIMQRSGLRGKKPCNCLCLAPYYQTANYGGEANCAIIGFQEDQNYGTNLKLWVQIVDENGNVQTSAGGDKGIKDCSFCAPEPEPPQKMVGK